MRKKTAQEYADELLKMYRENVQEISTPIQTLSDSPINPNNVFEDGTGGLQVNVTTLDRLYPVKDALVTIFVGDPKNMSAIETDTTDSSGKSSIFNLKTPLAFESQSADNGGVVPYSKYNISVRSDGYVERIVLNVPVFSGVISVQGIDLLPVSAAGKNTDPQITNEDNNYNL